MHLFFGGYFASKFMKYSLLFLKFADSNIELLRISIKALHVQKYWWPQKPKNIVFVFVFVKFVMHSIASSIIEFNLAANTTSDPDYSD